jgi:flagellar biosynthesis protein FlhF
MTTALAESTHAIEATFVADGAEDAFALAKRALGPEALIVSSRRIEQPGHGPRFEVRAATRPGLVGLVPPADPQPGPAPTSPRAASMLERILRDNDVPASYARDLALLERRPSRTLAEVRSNLLTLLRERVGFDDVTSSARILAMVGPTGVGKTTTIAKLAAHDALVRRRRVALISNDDYRVGGADQLSAFAELIGVPFAVASDAQSLHAELHRFALADRIYVDTAGRSPRNTSATAQLALTLAGTNASVVLCVSAATRSHELFRILAQHAVLTPRALVVTKLDEAELAGSALVAAVAAGVPLSHFTTGQRVPEDIELAGAHRLAAWMLGEEEER